MVDPSKRSRDYHHVKINSRVTRLHNPDCCNLQNRQPRQEQSGGAKRDARARDYYFDSIAAPRAPGRAPANVCHASWSDLLVQQVKTTDF